MDVKRIPKTPFIVTGHYGAGKTEFCVNFALSLRKITANKICIADLDVINPYFRSREKAEYLKGYDIEIEGNVTENSTGQDLPALSFAFLSRISQEQRVIVDLAGSANGLKVLASCYHMIKGYELLCALNLYRLDTNSKEKMIEFINTVNEFSRLPVTGLINTSHMLHETEAAHILESQEVIASVSEELNIPFEYTHIKRSVYDQIMQMPSSTEVESASVIKSNEVLIFDKLQMRETWH